MHENISKNICKNFGEGNEVKIDLYSTKKLSDVMDRRGSLSQFCVASLSLNIRGDLVLNLRVVLKHFLNYRDFKDVGSKIFYFNGIYPTMIAKISASR